MSDGALHCDGGGASDGDGDGGGGARQGSQLHDHDQSVVPTYDPIICDNIDECISTAAEHGVMEWDSGKVCLQVGSGAKPEATAVAARMSNGCSGYINSHNVSTIPASLAPSSRTSGPSVMPLVMRFREQPPPPLPPPAPEPTSPTLNPAELMMDVTVTDDGSETSSSVTSSMSSAVGVFGVGAVANDGDFDDTKRPPDIQYVDGVINDVDVASTLEESKQHKRGNSFEKPPAPTPTPNPIITSCRQLQESQTAHSHSTTDGDSIATSIPYSLANLPPRQILSACLDAFFRGYGLHYFFLPEKYTSKIYHAAYHHDPHHHPQQYQHEKVEEVQSQLSNAQSQSRSHSVYSNGNGNGNGNPNGTGAGAGVGHQNHRQGRRQRRGIMLTNAEFSFLLLNAAVGAIYAEDNVSDVSSLNYNSSSVVGESRMRNLNSIRVELFKAGKYHLDVAVGNIKPVPVPAAPVNVNHDDDVDHLVHGVAVIGIAGTTDSTAYNHTRQNQTPITTGLSINSGDKNETSEQRDNHNRDSQDQSLIRTSALATAALYLIFEKQFEHAKKYIDQAIHLAQKNNRLLMNSSSSSLRGLVDGGGGVGASPSGGSGGGGGDGIVDGGGTTGGEWETWRRVWRSLVFLDGWLSASVGYRPVTDTMNNYDPRNLNEIDNGLHAEMAKLGSLMSNITRDICAPVTFQMSQVREYNAQLKTWHDNLPDYLKLSEALDFKSDSAHRTSILLTHCAYLGSLILLTRRILIAQTRSLRGEPNHISFIDDDQEMVKLSHDCIYAARQLATVVGIFFMEGRLVRKCWLGIQSAFTSSLIIFLELAVLRRQYNVGPQSADLELVSRCMNALEHCAAVDPVAKSFFTTLAPIRNTLFPISAELVGNLNMGAPSSFTPRVPQHRSHSYPTTSASTIGSRESSMSPSKRARTIHNLDATRSNSAPTIPTIPTGLSSPTFSFPYAQPAQRIPTFSYPAAATHHMFSGHSDPNTIHVAMEAMRQVPQGIGGNDDSIDSILSVILDCLESPYGGDQKIVNESPPNMGGHPANMRFLNPRPQRYQQHPLIPNPNLQSPPSFVSSPITQPPSLHSSRNSSLSPQQTQQPIFVYNPDYHHPLISPSLTIPHLPQYTQRTQSEIGSPIDGTRMARAPSGNGSTSGVNRHVNRPKSVAMPGGPLPDIRMCDDDDAGSGDGYRRRKLPFKSKQDFENFLRRVA